MPSCLSPYSKQGSFLSSVYLFVSHFGAFRWRFCSLKWFPSEELRAIWCSQALEGCDGLMETMDVSGELRNGASDSSRLMNHMCITQGVFKQKHPSHTVAFFFSKYLFIHFVAPGLQCSIKGIISCSVWTLS